MTCTTANSGCATWSKRLLAVLASLFAIAAPAQATPPRLALINDMPLGITDSHLFVLRTVSDNTGSHFAGLEHQFLVRQSIRTGAAEQHWPVRRIHHIQRFDWPPEKDGQPVLSSRIIAEPPESTDEVRYGTDLFNPFAVMARVGAVPLVVGPPWNGSPAATFEVSETAGLVRLTEQKQDDREPGTPRVRREQLLGQPVLKEKIRKALYPTVDQMPKNGARVDPMDWSGASIGVGLDQCRVTSTFSHGLEFRDTIRTHEFVALTCEHEADVVAWTIWLAL